MTDMAETLSGMMWVALGAAVGGPLRFFVSGFVGRRIGETFPWGTLLVNVSGAFVIGAFAALASAQGVTPASSLWLLFVTGVLGSYTTVSSFSLQTLALARDGERWQAAGNIVGSLVFCLSAAAVGFLVASAVA